MSSEIKPLETLVETALYGDDLPALEAFYVQVLGLTVWSKDPARHVFFQVGPAHMLLLFKPAATLQAGLLPAHGAHGPGHAAFGISVDQLQPWRERLAAHGVPIELEYQWPRGGCSLYFRDPAGNSVELITPGVWGLPAGW
ncbi:MAG: VOC family protein [Planctomycetaceae bacterium]